MADDTPYDDDQSGGLLGKLISPLRAMGIDPDQARANPAAALAAVRGGQPPVQVADSRQPGSPDYAGPQLIPRNAAAPQRSVPASVTPDGNASGPPKTWQDYARQGLAGQARATQANESTVNSLAAQPTEEQTVAPLEQQRAYAANPIDPSQKQYRPGIGTRIVRGIDAVRRGGAFGAVDPGDVGGTPYGAPNRQYGIDTQQQAGKVASIDQQITTAQKAYKDASDRAKDLATQQRAVATGYSDLSKGAAAQEGEDNKATAEADKVKQDAAVAQQKQQGTPPKTYEETVVAANTETDPTKKAQYAAASKEMKDTELKKFQYAARTAGGDGGGKGPNEEARQPLIDKATEDVQSLQDQYTYDPEQNLYVDQKGTGTLTPARFTDKKNEISTKLDQQLTARKLQPLGVRFNEQAAEGTQYRKPTATSKARPAVGATVMVDGKPHKVVGFNEKSGKPIVAR